MSQRVLSVFGTRPEAIKMAPVVRALQRSADIESRLCVTGQHREMLDAVLDLFDLRPDHDLDLMRPGQDLFDVTGGVLLGLREVLRSEHPDLLLVHGDTTTCFAAALAAFYEGIPVGHVEAGLRTGDLKRPFPEELNRVLTGRMARDHFAPTRSAAENLLAEGTDPARVHVTGNTVIDALLGVRDRVSGREAGSFAGAFSDGLIERLDAAPERLVLVTGHRRESFGEGFERLCDALAGVARAHPDWLLVYPVHLNPNVRRPVQEHLGALPNVALVEPAEYEPFVWLMDRADLIVTDSGGVQEEAPALGVPVLVTREVTERPEAVEAGTVALVGTSVERITEGIEEVLGGGAMAERMTRAINPYGDGRASERIVAVLEGKPWEEFAAPATAPSEAAA